MLAMWTIFGILGASAQAAAPAKTTRCDAIIDVHLHAYDQDPRFEHSVPNPETGAPIQAKDGASHRRLLLETMRRAGIVRGIVSNEPLTAQQAAVRDSKGVLRLGYAITDAPTAEDLATIRRLHSEGRLTSIGEVEAPYAGVRFDDPRMEPLWALAEELNLPVFLHTGAGPTDSHLTNPRKRVTTTDLLALEEVIVRHPKLRIVLQHMGYPMAETTMAMMGAYSNLYVDTAAIDWLVPRAAFHSYIVRLVDAGFGDRIMFGSDAMTWPDAVPLAIEAVKTAPIADGAKRDILYRNARRLLGWTDLPAC